MKRQKCARALFNLYLPAGQIVKTTLAQYYNRFDSEGTKRDV